MKNYIIGVVFAFGILASPAFTQAAGLTSTQIGAIISLLQAFGADSATIANVNAALTGTPTTESTQSWCYTFNTNIAINPNNPDALQSVEEASLTHALSKEFPSLDTRIPEDVMASIVKFQAKYGISQTGYVGPITRAKLNSLYGCH